MAGICIQTISPNNCGHRDLTISIDGQEIVIKGHNADSAALTIAELSEFVRLAVRRARATGLSLTDMLGRVMVGEEATNVKIYPFFGPGATVTKTNIGTSYVNICPGLNGERQAVDFAGCTEYRIMLHANLIGTGAFAARIVKDSDNTVMHETTNLGAAGERELDSDWQSLPAAFVNAGLVYLRAQAKSATAADDPVYRSLKLAVR